MMDRHHAGSSKKLPRKPRNRSRPTRLDPLEPLLGDVEMLAAADSEEVPLPHFVLEKRLTQRRCAHPLPPLPQERVSPAPQATGPATSVRRSVSAEGAGALSSSTSEAVQLTQNPSLSLDDYWMQVHALTTVESNDTEFLSITPSDGSVGVPCYIAPASRETERTYLHGDVLTEALLQDWLGWDDLKQITAAEIRFDAEHMIGVDQLRSLMPSLISLRLNGSCIPSIRRLGTRYTHLKVLWLNNCRLRDLRGIGALGPNCKELYVAFNSISDLTPVLDISTTLEVLDVEGNQISDIPSLRFVLKSLTNVHTITLQGNAVEENSELDRLVQEEQESALSGSESESTGSTSPPQGHVDTELDDVFGKSPVLLFRRWVQLLMPWLQFLDDIPVLHDSPATAERLLVTEDRPSTALGRPGSSRDPVDVALREELRFVQECIRECGFDTLQETLQARNQEFFSRPTTFGGRCYTAHSGVTGSLRLGGRSSPAAAKECSSLTTGGVLTGSAIHSLRKRLLRQPPSPDHPHEEGGVRSFQSEQSSPSPGFLGGGSPRALSDAALLSWDDEEDEWEKLKADLMRDKLSANARMINQLQYRQRYEELKNNGLLPTTTSTSVHSEDGTPAAVASDGALEEKEEESFDSFLKHEIIRTRAQIARGGNTGQAPGEAACDFIANQNGFEVVDLGSESD